MSFFNEMYRGDEIRPEYRLIADWIAAQGADVLTAKRAEAEALFRRVGITFAVYGEGGDPERLIPFDMVPRVFSAREWDRIETGSIQRANALNAFLRDIYGAREIVKAGILPESMIAGNEAYEGIMEGVSVPGGVFSHIIGVDLVRVSEDEFYVLE
ncbi:MAG: circularly permuted type 2 ATP-grasp protein, partial [Rubricella sp.]